MDKKSFSSVKNQPFAKKKIKTKCGTDLITSIFEESSVHGMAQVSKDKRHVFERFLWLFIIALSIYAAIVICLDQWNRYQENPTVLSLETNYRNWVYEQCGITICSNYTNPDIGNEIVQSLWGVTPNDTKYQYYLDFVYTVSTTRFNNLYKYEKFAKDENFYEIDLLAIMRTMKLILIPPLSHYTHVLTEMGICHSTTKLYKYQNPFSDDKNQTKPKPNPDVCRSTDTCKITVMPTVLDSTDLTIYIHNENDVISGQDTIHEMLIGDLVVDVELEISDMKASDSLLRLSPERRKCLFFKESNSSYFDVYTINLCKITCRLKAAIRNCRCRPFFYNIDNAGPVCTPAGMFCLSKTNWYDSDCVCPKLCETEIFIRVHSETLKFFQFSRMLVINTVFPKNRIKRNVLFSFEDLLVSFGGAAALFLGFSFLSVMEFIFLTIEHIIKLCCGADNIINIT